MLLLVQLDANIKRSRSELSRLDELLHHHKQERAEAVRERDANEAAAAEREAASESVAKTLDFSSMGVAPQGADVKHDITPALSDEDRFVLGAVPNRNIAAIKAVVATAQPAKLSLLKAKPRLTSDMRAAVAAVVLENRCARCNFVRLALLASPCPVLPQVSRFSVCPAPYPSVPHPREEY